MPECIRRLGLLHFFTEPWLRSSVNYGSISSSHQTNATEGVHEMQVSEEVFSAATAEVLGDSSKVQDALCNLSAFDGKNPRDVGIDRRRTWDSWTDEDLRDADGQFDSNAPAGAMFFGLMFGDDKTSQRCRFQLAQKVEKYLEDEILNQCKRIAHEVREWNQEIAA